MLLFLLLLMLFLFMVMFDVVAAVALADTVNCCFVNNVFDLTTVCFPAAVDVFVIFVFLLQLFLLLACCYCSYFCTFFFILSCYSYHCCS